MSNKAYFKNMTSEELRDEVFYFYKALENAKYELIGEQLAAIKEKEDTKMLLLEEKLLPKERDIYEKLIIHNNGVTRGVASGVDKIKEALQFLEDHVIGDLTETLEREREANRCRENFKLIK